MNKIIFAASLFLIPTSAFAACLPVNSTVVYINGINTSVAGAHEDLRALSNNFYQRTGDASTIFINAYSPTNNAFADGLKVVTQMLAWSPDKWNEDVNGDTILNQIYSDLTTQKVLLVGYSQGAFYTNETYKYLTTHGLAAGSVANYGIGTPASYVAGGGGYLTSSNDTLINDARRLAENAGLARPLPANITIAPSVQDETGHMLDTTYLTAAASDIVGTMQHELVELSATSGADMPTCFTPPSDSVLHKVAISTSDVGTTLGTVAYLWGASTYNGTLAAAASAFDAASQIASDIKTTLGGINGLAHSAEPQYQSTDYNIIDKLYGGINQTVDGQTLQDLLGTSQGGAVILATTEDPTPVAPNSGPVVAPSSTIPVSSLIPINVSPGFGGGGGGGSGTTDSAGDVANVDSAPVTVETTPAEEPTVVDDTASTTDAADISVDNATTISATSTGDTTLPPAPSPDDPASWPPAGFFCSGDTSILTPSDTPVSYRPAAAPCTYIAGFKDDGWVMRGMLLKGVVGSSTVVEDIGTNNSDIKSLTGYNHDFSNLVSGDNYVVALFEYNNNVGGNYNAYYYGDMLHYLMYGTRNDGTPSAPPLTHYLIPFVIP